MAETEKTYPEITIRRFQMSDEALVDDFYKVMGEESAGFFNRERCNEIRCKQFFTGERDDHIFWGAFTEENGKEVMAGLTFIWDIDSTVPWFGIAVRENLKGMHVGTRMLEYVSDFCEATGYGGILLTTAQNNFRGQGLYEKCGFQRLGVHSCGEFMYIKRFEFKA